MDIREFKELLFKVGQEKGLENMEIYVTRSRDFSVRIFQKEVDDYKVSLEQGVGFRARYKGKVGSAYVEAVTEESIDLLVEGAKANAEIVDSDDEIIFFEGSAEYPQVDALNEDLREISPEEKIEYAKALEVEAFAADERVSLVSWATTGYGETDVYIANTQGLEQSFSRNSVYSFVNAMVKKEETVKTGGRFYFKHDWSEMDAKKQAQEAVLEGVSLLDASTVKSGEYRVLLRYDVMRALLDTFSSVFSADAVQKGLSLLQGKLGNKIASPNLTLIDDPLLPHGGASTPFDGEGVATQTKEVISQGKLQTFLHNLKTATKDGVESTGNASRASFKSPLGISPTNFFIKPGTKSFDELIAQLETGLIIINVQGTHSGANPVSGDFSLGAYGYLVENGKIVRAVDQITIAGNFFTLLESVEEIGSDLEFGIPGSGGNVGSPSLIVNKLAIAGN